MISSPAADGAAVSGVYTFTVDAVTSAPTTATVEYKMGSVTLGVATASPFSFSWNTGYGNDGNHALQAIARDASGVIVATGTQIFNIQNHGVSMVINSPDITQPLSGTISVSMLASDTAYYPRIFVLFIDGRHAGYWDTGSAPNQHTVTASFSLDTRQFSNGTHELAIHMTAVKNATGPDVYINYEGDLNRIITINNGHTLQEIMSNALHAYLKPGQTLQLACNHLYTDGVTDACASPTFSSGNPAAATVSAGGVVAAAAKGFTDIAITDSGKTTDVYVWVNGDFNIRHFSQSGQILNSYQPGSSVFPVNLFVLDPSFLQADDSLAAETRRSGINTLGFGFYLNPRSTSVDYSTWLSSQDNQITSRINYAKNNGYYIYATGDDGFRRPGDDAWWTLNWQYGQQASNYAMQTLANSGVAIAVDVVDEASSFWGWYPTNPTKVGEQGLTGQPASFQSISCNGTICTVSWPSGHNFNNGYWVAFRGSIHPELNTLPGQPFIVQNATQTSFDFVPNGPVSGVFTASSDANLEILLFAPWPCNANTTDGLNHPCVPFTPNNAVQTYANWIHGVTPRVPISWPALGILPPAAHANWEGQLAINQGISDFASHYWDVFDNSRTYPWGAGVEQRVYWMRNAYYSRQPYFSLDRPQVMLVNGSSYAYIKNSSTDAYYNPFTDTLDQPGGMPRVVVGEFMTAVAMGNSAVRQYQFDTATAAERAGYSAGSYLQTGIRPASGDPNAAQMWKATGYVSNVLTRTLLPYILGQAATSPALGKDIVTAVRQTPSGNMFMVINANDAEKMLTVSLSPYQTGNAITRYTVSDSGIKTSVLANISTDAVTLAPGATAVYLFPSLSSKTYAQNIVFTPTLPPGAVKAYLRYNYIYDQDLDRQTDGMNCTASCSLQLDTALGDIYYQYSYLDQDGNLIGRSSILKIPVSFPDVAPPTIPTNLQASPVSSSQINVSWTASTDNSAVGGYIVFRNGQQVGVSTSLSFTDVNLAPATAYAYTASAYDGSGNVSAQSSTVTAKTFPDSVAPVTTITNPLNGSTVPKNATVKITANASDNVSVTKVEFYVGGSQTCTSAVAPYNCNWKVPAAANKSYTLQTKAYDAAGNIGTSPPVTVTSK